MGASRKPVALPAPFEKSDRPEKKVRQGGENLKSWAFTGALRMLLISVIIFLDVITIVLQGPQKPVHAFCRSDMVYMRKNYLAYSECLLTAVKDLSRIGFMGNSFHDLFGRPKSNIQEQLDIVDEQIQAVRDDDRLSDHAKAEEIKKLELTKAQIIEGAERAGLDAPTFERDLDLFGD